MAGDSSPFACPHRAWKTWMWWNGRNGKALGGGSPRGGLGPGKGEEGPTAWSPSPDKGSPGRARQRLETLDCGGNEPSPVQAVERPESGPGLTWRFPSAGHRLFVRMVDWPEGTLRGWQWLESNDTRGRVDVGWVGSLGPAGGTRWTHLGSCGGGGRSAAGSSDSRCVFPATAEESGAWPQSVRIARIPRPWLHVRRHAFGPDDIARRLVGRLGHLGLGIGGLDVVGCGGPVQVALGLDGLSIVGSIAGERATVLGARELVVHGLAGVALSLSLAGMQAAAEGHAPTGSGVFRWLLLWLLLHAVRWTASKGFDWLRGPHCRAGNGT